MKIKQVAIHPAGSLFALTETGELYCGFFSGLDSLDRPVFGWRKVPEIKSDAFEFKCFEEMTPEEYAIFKKHQKVL
jgi:hypothetical protein